MVDKIYNADQLEQLLTESGDILNEGVIERLAYNVQGFFTVEYNPKISQSIIESYISDYDVTSLKDYMFKLYLMSIEDEPTGIVKTLKFMLSDRNRESYYRYRTKLTQQLNYGEKAIQSITRRNFNFNKYAEQRLTELGKNPTANEAVEIATNVVSGTSDVKELVGCAKWAIGAYTTSAVLNNVVSILSTIITIGTTIVGWTAKIISFIVLNIIFGIIGLAMG